MPPVAVGKPHTKADLDLTWGSVSSQTLGLIAKIKEAKAYLDTLTLTDLQDASIGYTAAGAQEMKDAAAELANFADTTATPRLPLTATRRIAGPSTLQ